MHQTRKYNAKIFIEVKKKLYLNNEKLIKFNAGFNIIIYNTLSDFIIDEVTNILPRSSILEHNNTNLYKDAICKHYLLHRFQSLTCSSSIHM